MLQGKVVGFRDLAYGDIVTAISLDGSLVLEKVTVQFNASTFEGFDYTDQTGARNPHGAVGGKGATCCKDRGGWILIKFTEVAEPKKTPENWPPQENDVWEVLDRYTNKVTCAMHIIKGKPVCLHEFAPRTVDELLSGYTKDRLRLGYRQPK